MLEKSVGKGEIPDNQRVVVSAQDHRMGSTKSEALTLTSATRIFSTVTLESVCVTVAVYIWQSPLRFRKIL